MARHTEPRESFEKDRRAIARVRAAAALPNAAEMMGAQWSDDVQKRCAELEALLLRHENARLERVISAPAPLAGRRARG